MPSASELRREKWLRVLLLGEPKVGKTTMAIATSPKPVHVMLCESDSALLNAMRETKADFTFDRVETADEALEVLYKIGRRARKKKVGTFILDPLSGLGTLIEDACLDEEADGRRAYGKYGRLLRQITHQLLNLSCHVVAISHYEESADEEDQGRVPMLSGKSKRRIAGMFPDIVWMDYNKGNRILVTGPQGAWGPGCRSVKGTMKLNADIHSGKKVVGIKKLIRVFERAAADDAAEATPTKS